MQVQAQSKLELLGENSEVTQAFLSGFIQQQGIFWYIQCEITDLLYEPPLAFHIRLPITETLRCCGK
jgi:hypothetical protein